MEFEYWKHIMETVAAIFHLPDGSYQFLGIGEVSGVQKVRLLAY